VETGLFVKDIWWHRVKDVAPDGKLITGCGRRSPGSMMCSSIDTVEMGNGCPECLPEKAPETAAEPQPPTSGAETPVPVADLPVEPEAAQSLATLPYKELLAMAAHRGMKVPAGTSRVKLLEILG
jgi:hypothetical protein